MDLAGSAIAQGPSVGRIDRWSEWNPTSIEPLWLLLSGASDPPKDISISRRRTGGTFLPGVAHDLANVQDAVGTKLLNVVQNLKTTKSEALGHIRSLFETCGRRKVKPILYYTGHGEVWTGDWCFADGTISIHEILGTVPAGTHFPMIFSDACYSGHWANVCLDKQIDGFHCLAACPEFSTASDTKGEGGDLTLFMTGKKLRPSTEPMYSGGNIRDFPITIGYDSVEYNDFIGNHLFSSEDILISQSLHNGYFSGIFFRASIGQYRLKRSIGCSAIRSDYDSFLKLVKENWNRINGESRQIYSLACDDNLGFGVFFMENYGTAQTIVTNTSDVEKKLSESFNITACAARGSTFYFIMTKDTKEYKGKAQRWFTCNTWTEASNDIKELIKEGYIITGICYSTELRQYFVVMTKSRQNDQRSAWFHEVADRTGNLVRSAVRWTRTGISFPLSKKRDHGYQGNIDWMIKQYRMGYRPTVIFKDPTDNTTLVVMTKYFWSFFSTMICRFDYKLK